MKKIDKLVLDAFIGPFLITFFVVVFILLNINMLKYFDDIIGKGLDTLILGQLFFYFAIFTVPTAMPLAVLLSSLIAFGNLGEHFELTAIKSCWYFIGPDSFADIFVRTRTYGNCFLCEQQFGSESSTGSLQLVV